MSSWLGRREEMGRGEEREIGRLERVERKRRVVRVVADGGRRLSSSSRRVEMGVVGGRARERVGGRPLPAKLVTSTLILLGLIVLVVGVGAFDDFGWSGDRRRVKSTKDDSRWAWVADD